MNPTIDIDKIYEKLEEAHLPQSIFVQYMQQVHDPFKVLTSCILSLRTQDKVTYEATLRLFKLGKTPEELLQHNEEEISNAIYPVGFYKTKARTILEICHRLLTEYNSKVPDSIDELLKFKGVGRKTANLVMTRGFDKPGICVDTHVHRIMNRVGYVNTSSPDETEMVLRKKLPVKYWKNINELLVTLGQNICMPMKAKHEICPIEKYCLKIMKPVK